MLPLATSCEASKDKGRSCPRFTPDAKAFRLWTPAHPSAEWKPSGALPLNPRQGFRAPTPNDQPARLDAASAPPALDWQEQETARYCATLAVREQYLCTFRLPSFAATIRRFLFAL